MEPCGTPLADGRQARYAQLMAATDGVQVSVRYAGEGARVAIITLEGKLQLGGSPQRLRHAVSDQVQSGLRTIVLDMQRLTSIDSAGLGTLMACYTTVRNLGGRLRLLQPTNRVRDVLNVVKLLPLFEISEDEASAIAGA